MKKLNRQKVWQAAACLACASVLWIHLNDFGASEFRGGRLTGKLLTMADAACLLFLAASLLTIFFPRVAAVVALTGTLLSLPSYLYILAPGPYRHIFKGEYSVPLQRPFVWNNWAAVGVLSLISAVFEPSQSFQRALGTCAVRLEISSAVPITAVVWCRSGRYFFLIYQGLTILRRISARSVKI